MHNLSDISSLQEIPASLEGLDCILQAMISLHPDIVTQCSSILTKTCMALGFLK